jgi:DNA-binding NtrC family response regulator
MGVEESVDSPPTIDQKVWRVFIDGYAKNDQEPARVAKSLLLKRLTKLQRALCLETSARAEPPNEALRLLDAAREAFSGAADNVQATRFEVRYARAVLTLFGIDAAQVEVTRIRNSVLLTGDVHAVVDLHLLSAAIEAQRNKPSRAAAHLRTADVLLETHPNLVHRARLHHLRSNLFALASDYTNALSAATASLSYSRDAGWTALEWVSLGNVVLFKLALGETEGAGELLSQGIDCLRGFHGQQLAARDTQIQLLLATNDPQLDEIAEEAWRSDYAGEWRHSYYGLWHHPTRMTWLLRKAQFKDAARLGVDVLPVVRKSGDRTLLTRMSLLTADALAAQGDVVQAFRIFSDVFAQSDDYSLELIAELQRVAARLLVASDKAGAIECLQRADDLLGSAGLLTQQRALREMAVVQLGISTFPTRSSMSAFFEGVSRTTEELTRQSLRSVSTLIQVASYPEALGREVIEMIRTANLAYRVDVRRKVPGQPPVTVITETFSELRGLRIRPSQFAIARTDDGEYSLEVYVRDDSSSQVAWCAMRQVITASLDLRDARARVREAAPVWPDSTPEQELGMVTAAEKMLELVRIARRLAPSNITVLITGETGTGKELLARALHDASPRAQKPFIPFNCTAIAREMLDAQLFGYRRGAFTGATEAFPGVIRAAAGGTLFLDEIGELSSEVQPKLLRFLESGEIHPLGEPAPVTVDVRVVAATNADLEALVAAGRFREDLFYRLNVVRLEVPPLRERREEIPLLVQHYIDRASRESHKHGIRVAEETMEYLVLYRWPGNVRQLANEVRKFVALAESGAVIMPEHLSREIAATRRTVPASERDLAPTEFVVRVDQPMSAATEHLERAMIQYAMRLADGRVEDAAQMLGLSRKGLYLKRHRLGIDLGDLEGDEDEALAAPAES